MFCSSSVYGSKGRSKDYLPRQYHYNALVEREYEICSPLVSFDLRCESVTFVTKLVTKITQLGDTLKIGC